MFASEALPWVYSVSSCKAAWKQVKHSTMLTVYRGYEVIKWDWIKELSEKISSSLVQLTSFIIIMHEGWKNTLATAAFASSKDETSFLMIVMSNIQEKSRKKVNFTYTEETKKK